MQAIAHYIQSYQISCLVGDGSQGQAFLAKKDGIYYVAKVYFQSQKAHHYYTQQVEIFTGLDCPYIIKMIEHFPQAKVFLGQNEEIRPVIVLEFAQHGELFKLVNLGKFSEQVSRTIFYQLMTAIKYLKDKGITHRDIKMENILLDSSFNLKLADFGFARKTILNTLNQQQYLKSWRGSQLYMAPEIHNFLYKGEKVDVFASGVVLFLMYLRIPPFENTEITNQKYNLIRQNRFSNFWGLYQRKYSTYSADFKSLIEGLFVCDFQKRLTVEEILSHKWLQGKKLTQEEIIAYLHPRYERLITRDHETQNIRRNLRNNLQRMMEQRQNRPRSRSRERMRREEDHPGARVQKDLTFIDEVLSLNFQGIISERFKENNLFYCKVEPKIIVFWIENYLSSIKSEKKQVFDQAIESIRLDNYTFTFEQNGNLGLRLQLEIISDKDSGISQLQLKGKIKKYDCIHSIFLQGEVGNQYWNYEVIQKIQHEFYLTFS